ncbi:MAG: type II toxin-antitoxin system VapC family toxin [Candidatus Woesearchaeota archaeon]
MSQLVYVDTNVYLDYLFNRVDRLRPLGDFAFEFFRKCIQCSYTIVISDWVLVELQKNASDKHIQSLLDWFVECNKIVWVEQSKEDVQKAKVFSHWQDRLHEILAKKAGARYIVTRNIRDFLCSGDSIQIQLPESM